MPKAAGPRGPLVPFVGLAEGVVLTGMRRAGVPLQRIRPALTELERQFGLNNALASQKLYTDGAEVLSDSADSADDETASALRHLVVVPNGQRVFVEVMAQYLQRIDFDSDGWARLLRWSSWRTPSAGDALRGMTSTVGHFTGLPDLLLDRRLGISRARGRWRASCAPRKRASGA